MELEYVKEPSENGPASGEVFLPLGWTNPWTESNTWRRSWAESTRGYPKEKLRITPGVRPPQLKLRVRSQSFQLISLRKVGQLPLLSSALRWRIAAESGAKGLVVPLQGEPEVPDGQVGAKQLAIEGTISVLCYGEFLGEEGQGALPVPPHLLLQGAAPKWVAEASLTTDRGARG